MATAAVTVTACESSKKKTEAPKNMSELLVRLSTKSRHVFVSGTIDDEMAKAVIAQLLFLEQEGPGTPICMHINSSGGKVRCRPKGLTCLA